MEPLSLTSSLFALLVTLCLLLLFRHHRRGQKLNLPPGPKPWPIIGNLNLIGRLPHRSMHSLSHKYGPLMYLHFGSSPAIVASSMDTIKAVLKTQDLSFASRPKSSFGKYTTYNYKDIVWAPYGPYWLQARKICLMELFSAKRLDQLKHIRSEETKSVVKGLYESSRRPINLRDHLMTFSLNTILRMVLGENYMNSEERSGTQAKVKEVLHEFSVLNEALFIGDSIPLLRFLDLQGTMKRLKAVGQKYDRILDDVFNEHDERRKAGADDYVTKDYADVLLQFGDNDRDLDIKLERHEMKAIISNLIGAGTENAAIAVEWVISDLLKNPEIFKKATDELDNVIGTSRWVEEHDIANLPYFNAILKESMRLHPVAPLLIPRSAREDCKISGYDIPAGTRVFVNTWSISRDPSVWKDPEEFRPERFIGNSIDVLGHDIELLPFGAGRRVCVGLNLGLKMIHISLANLLHGFDWKLPHGMRKEDLGMEEIFGLTTPRKFPLMAVAEPRLPTALYTQ